MLILSRKEDESILLGKDIKITVVGISKSGVKLGIEAPKNMMILRSELAEEVANKNKEAIKQSDEAVLAELSQKIQK
ncbi:carbon storage regulator CsrA [Campylobacter sp.]|uniref:carbon storage regulator CsrA n=1 Tax=Campylobacter sp. TaxID=205 RepID=UPI002703D62E|nr:carbon storage regulator CsrA [Campylobacter sp.]